MWSAFVEFWVEWKKESNPWREAYLEGGGTFERSMIMCCMGFAVLHFVATALGKKYGPPLSGRPTVLAATFHAGSTSILAIYVLWINRGKQEGEEVDFSIWQQWALPLSLAYFVAEFFWYCVPRRDVLISVHHVIMCFCHYPVGHDAGAVLAGAGNPNWVLWLSAMGYTSELSSVLMNYRWYLLETLDSNWIGFGICNVLVALSWAGRVVLFGYLLVFEIAPLAPLYAEKKQLLTYVIMVFGHVVIGVLSMYWLRIMCRGGFKSLLVFKKKKSSGGGFTFGADIGRDDDATEATTTTPTKADDTTPVAPPMSPRQLLLQTGVNESRAYVNGTLFNATSKRVATAAATTDSKNKTQ
uniref:TLC domain-containing protein n=1 Tax=Attheya septentrionalis TaxID=420275 RepID=A0A7S2U7B6_9STRA|mmetsp:Transcript_13601/g.24652  ORF Transcript_13601/g.24652 Transcript_13601/m.24652 type:complete len:355 (-) Transcript_13601:194-1258(-)